MIEALDSITPQQSNQLILGVAWVQTRTIRFSASLLPDFEGKRIAGNRERSPRLQPTSIESDLTRITDRDKTGRACHATAKARV